MKKFIGNISKNYMSLPSKVRFCVFIFLILLAVFLSKAIIDRFNRTEPDIKAYVTDNNSGGSNGKKGDSIKNPIKKVPEEVIIVIDPGHGGDDLGAYHGTFYEKDVNLDISKKLGKKLEEAGIKVVYTREDDVFVDLDPRVDIANNLGATLFISVHNNAMPDNSQYRGTETLYCPPAVDTGSKMDGKKLAEIVQQELVKTLKTVDNGIIYRPNLAVLRKTKMPAVIAEIAYISNASDREKLKNDEFRQKAADALSNAVLKALEKMNARKDENGVWKIVEE